MKLLLIMCGVALVPIVLKVLFWAIAILMCLIHDLRRKQND